LSVARQVADRKDVVGIGLKAVWKQRKLLIPLNAASVRNHQFA
jgi:hypothetical protein